MSCPCGCGQPPQEKTGKRGPHPLYASDECRKREYARRAREEWTPRDRYAESRAYRLQRRYGITVEEYNQMYDDQDGACAICGIHEDVFQVDHDHETGHIRGLLCRECNKGLGSFRDQIVNLQSAIQYLE